MKTKCKHFDFELAQSAGIPVDRFPETAEEAIVAQELLVQSLDRLSLHEHERILFDIHGIEHIINDAENPSMVEEKLAELQYKLDRTSNKDAYNLAKQLNPEYVFSRCFRLMFLRCEMFNAESAAEMMVRHFEEKRRLFGDGDVLAREVLQSDLGPKERTVLESGMLQIMRERDAADRMILLVVPSIMTSWPPSDYSYDVQVCAINISLSLFCFLVPENFLIVSSALVYVYGSCSRRR